MRQLVPYRALTHSESVLYTEHQAAILLKTMQVFEPPVRIEELVLEAELAMAIEVDPTLPKPARAKLNPDGTWRIALRRMGRLPDRRVLIAHEAKHIIDHGQVDRLYPPAEIMSSEDRGEYLAAYFSVCLLMPREWVERFWRSGVCDVRELAQTFGVSVRAMRFRLEALGLLAPVSGEPEVGVGG